MRQLHAYPKRDGGRSFDEHAPPAIPAAAYDLGAPLLVGEISSRWQLARSRIEPTAATSMAEVGAAARARGYAGIFAWAYTCDPTTDRGCISRAEIASGLQAAAGFASAAAAERAAFPAGLGRAPYAHVRNIRACDCADRYHKVGGSR